MVESDPLNEESLGLKLAVLLRETIDDIEKSEEDLFPLTEN